MSQRELESRATSRAINVHPVSKTPDIATPRRAVRLGIGLPLICLNALQSWLTYQTGDVLGDLFLGQYFSAASL